MSSSLRAYWASLRQPENIGLHLLIIVVLGLVCYGNTFSVPFYFDDYDELVNDPSITEVESLWDLVLHGGARRFADLSFAINYQVHGLHVAGYHAVNTVIHLLSAVAVYFLCVSIIKALEKNFSGDRPESHESALAACRFIPLAVSLIFVSHPLQTQAVTYIIQRYTSLVGCLYVFTMLAYVKGRLCFEQQEGRSAAGWCGWGAVAALLGVYTKQSFFSLPLMILLFEQCLFHGRFTKQILTGTVVTACLAVAAKSLPILFNGGTIGELMYHLHDATSENFFSTRTDYFLTQLRVVVTYLRLVFLPVGQRLDYDYPEFNTLLNIEVLVAAVLHLMLVSFAVMLYLRSKYSQPDVDETAGLCRRLIVVGIAWFYIALSVTSSFIPIPDDFAEHRMYLPSVGLFIAIAAVVQIAAAKYGSVLRYRKLGLAIVCLALALTTIARNHVWSDELRFWQNEAQMSPNNGRVIGNLGFAYLRRDSNELALRAFAHALKLDPSLQTVWIALGPTLQGLNLYQGRFSTGEEHLTPEGNIDYRYNRLFYGCAFNALGLVNEFIGQHQDAMICYNKSLKLNPRSDAAWYNFGRLSLQLGNVPQAQLATRKLNELDSLLAGTLESR